MPTAAPRERILHIFVIGQCAENAESSCEGIEFAVADNLTGQVSLSWNGAQTTVAHAAFDDAVRVAENMAR